MPYIKVNINKLTSFQETLNSIQRRVNNIQSDFSSIGNSLDWDVRSSSNINSRIKNINKELGIESQSIKKMVTFITNSKSQYATLDESKVKVQTLNSGTSNTTVKQSSSSPWKTIGKVVGKMGFVGSAVSGLINFTNSTNLASGAKSVVDLMKSGKDVVKGLMDWRKASKNTAIYSKLQPGKATAATGKLWKSAFGLNDIFKGKASKFKSSWTKRFSRNFNKRMDSQVGSFKKGGATSAFAWIGLGLNLAGNAVSNYEEAKNDGISTQRAIAETITETVVDTATGWVIGAGVAAGLAATIGSAPVLVVGAATVGITMGLDYACKKITGAITGTEKGLTETISDAVLDVGTAISKGAKNIVSGVGKFFGKLFG